MDRKLLEILCCPQSKRPVSLLDKNRLEVLNERIVRGEVLNVGGEKVEEPLQAALVTDDNQVVYPVRDDIPVMLIEKGIGTTQFSDW